MFSGGAVPFEAGSMRSLEYSVWRLPVSSEFFSCHDAGFFYGCFSVVRDDMVFMGIDCVASYAVIGQKYDKNG